MFRHLPFACILLSLGTVAPMGELAADKATDGGETLACHEWVAPSGYRYVARGGGCRLEHVAIPGPNYDDPNLSDGATDGPLYRKSIDELEQDLKDIQRRINDIGQNR